MQSGDDLFPKDFVIQLPRPAGYTGTEELFGVSAQDREVLRTVPRKTCAACVHPGDEGPPRSSSITSTIGFPRRFTNALISFCLSGAVRALRPNLSSKSNTMLVHVSARTIDQERIAGFIEDQVELWRAADRQGQALQPVFEHVWEQFKKGLIVPPDDRTVIREAIGILRRLVILVLNSVTGENLEYDEKPGRHIVAVGGNRLSRGLTLEGLTVSYFLRTASMCDTLLQMARWYGFRRGYEDLIRIWTTDGIARWFSELALVEQSLRDSIISLERAHKRPDQMAIRLRAHSDLLLTARNKSIAAQTVQDSWSGEHPQTVLLPLSDPTKLRSNRDLTDRFISELSTPQRCYGGFLVRDVAPDVVCTFLRRYAINEDIIAFRNDLLADWITGRAVSGELTDWAVFVASPTSERQAAIGGRNTGLVTRNRVSSESIGILTDPRHEGVDLAGGPDAYRRESGTYDSDAMRAARPATQGLIIIYPLDAAKLGVDCTDVVIALALSLPSTSDSGTSWIVNSRLSGG